MRLHVEALFTHDTNGDLVRVNEPNGAPAPRFFLGRTISDSVIRFRYDVTPDLRRELLTAARDAARTETTSAPEHATRYQEILARVLPVERIWTGPAFTVPPNLPVYADVVAVNGSNANVLESFLAPWLPDVLQCQPMCVLLVGGHAVSVCASVRQTGRAHEAGVETVAEYRGRGFAGPVVAEWARCVRERHRVPLYSTSWQNEASRAVARKLGLVSFGADLHIS